MCAACIGTGDPGDCEVGCWTTDGEMLLASGALLTVTDEKSCWRLTVGRTGILGGPCYAGSY